MSQRTLFVEWLVIALRLVVLVVAPTAAWLSLGPGGGVDSVASSATLLCAILLWSLVIGRRVLLSDDDDAAGMSTSADVVCEQLLVIVVACKTLALLDRHSVSRDYDLLWLVPLAATSILVALDELDTHKPAAGGSTSTYQLVATTPATVLQRRRLLGVTTMALVCGSVAVVLLDASSTSTTGLTLAVVELFVLLLAVTWIARRHPADGERHVVLLVWLFCQVAVLAADVEPMVRLARGGTVATVVLLLLLDNVIARELGAGVVAATRELFGWVLLLVSSPMPYQLGCLGAALVVTLLSDRVWYRTHIDFPPVVRVPCGLALDFMDDVIRPLYEFTSDTDFQNTIALALPEIGNLRNSIFRVLATAYIPVLTGSNGKDAAYAPTGDVISLVLLGGCLLCALAVVLQVFPRGGRYMASRAWLWAFGFLAGLLYLASTHLTSDAPMYLYFLAFGGSGSYSRTYTSDGHYALAAQLLFVACCLVLHVMFDLRHDIFEAQPPQPPQMGFALRLRVPSVRGVLDDARKALRALLYYITAPSVVVLAASIALVVITMIAAGGSPIEKVRPYKMETGSLPDWVVSTNVDKISAIPGFLSLVNMINPAARLAILIQGLTIYALERIGCWGCLCLPGDIGGAFGKVADGFSSAFSFRRRRRRRLLEHRRHMTAYGDTAVVAYDQSHEAMPHFTDLHDRCDSSGCDGTQICVIDIVKEVVDQIQTITRYGLRLAGKLMAEAIRLLIPIADALDFLLGQIGSITELFEPFTGVLFDLPSVDLGLNLDFAVAITLGLDHLLPAIPSLSANLFLVLALLVLIAASLYVAYRQGLLESLIHTISSILALSVASLLVTLLVALALFTSLLRDQLRAERYDIELTWKVPHAILIAIGLGGCALAGLLRLGESAQTQALRRRAVHLKA
jgi:hypothetical protein